MHEEIHLHWLVTARVNSHFGIFGLGDGSRPFSTKGDDGGRYCCRRQVNRVFMSWRFDRPDFPDLESHSGCRASGPDSRDFPPPEETPLIVVLHLAFWVRPAVHARGACRGSTPLSEPKVGGPSLVVLWCGDRGHPFDTRAPLSWLSDLPHLPRLTRVILRLKCPPFAG